MSWSYSETGRTETVRDIAARVLSAQAEHCATIPFEQASVQAFAATIDAACAAAPGQAIKVEGNGSAWVDRGSDGAITKVRAFNFNAKIELIPLD